MAQTPHGQPKPHPWQERTQPPPMWLANHLPPWTPAFFSILFLSRFMICRGVGWSTEAGLGVWAQLPGPTQVTRGSQCGSENPLHLRHDPWPTAAVHWQIITPEDWNDSDETWRRMHEAPRDNNDSDWYNIYAGSYLSPEICGFTSMSSQKVNLTVGSCSIRSL